MTEEIDRKIFNTQRGIVVWAFVAPTALSLGLLGACVAMFFLGKDVPSSLSNLAAASTGYLWGSLPAMVKDFIQIKRAG